MNKEKFLLDIIKNISVGIIAINKELKVIDINDKAIEIFGSCDPINKSGGYVFNCLYTSMQGVCGHSAACGLCDLRRIVLDTFKNKKHLEDIRVSPDLLKNKKLDKPILNMSSIYLENEREGYVILVVEDISKTVNGSHEKYESKLKDYEKIQSEVFSTVSHELKTPLNLLFSAIQLFEMKFKNNRNMSSDMKYLEIVKKNYYRLFKTINNMIDILRISVGDRGIQREIVNVVEVVEKICTFMIPTVTNLNRKILFTTNVEEKIMEIDTKAIEKILINLISNAIKFTCPNDTIIVKLYCRKNKLYIFVKDSGVGIPDDKQNIIFEKFGQVSPVLNRYHEGSGLGLSLVKSLIELLNGEVYVKSKVNHGSTFVVKLPVQYLQENVEYNKYMPCIDEICASVSDIYN